MESLQTPLLPLFPTKDGATDQKPYHGFSLVSSDL